ncbi:NXPE family member 2 isoform X4 [Zootoca vivipara]|uniref:NXPE family member 2 isoform X4 n=1 Tax=Zootoca vivipara TaxID=8524 RepID=UPI0015905D7B|nr:NXPE family member 2 isoform X4 [Zootoca vivipara]
MAIVMMFFITIKRKGFLLTLGLAGFLILSYTLYRRVFKITLVGDHNRLMKEPGDFLGALERNEDFCLRFMGNRICQTETAAQCRTRVQRWKKEQEVKEILTKLDQLMPSVTFTDIMTTTSARNSKATILNQKGSYCVGDPLMVRLDLYNYLGERKKYGGDFLRVRIYSSSLGAGASGHITDYRNGTYLVNFTLFWEGDVKVSILLIHPSEGVSALWAARKRGYDKIDFRGKFLNGTSLVYTKCGFVIETNAELCEYLDERDQEAFYCVKPKNVPCEAFVLLTSDNNPITYLTSLEQSLFRRDNIGIEIPQSFGEIRVLSCNTLKFFDRDSDELFKTHVALDLERSTFIQWKRHGNPFVSRKLFSVKDGNYITNEIDRLAGDKDTVIAITLGQHFRPFPMDLFVRRLLNIRRAIHHLLLRSPETRVIIRTENTREMDTDMERLGDVNGYPQNLAVMDIFLGLNVGFIDAWDMNIAYAIYDVHPPDHVIWNQIIMFLTYIC